MDKVKSFTPGEIKECLGMSMETIKRYALELLNFSLEGGESWACDHARKGGMTWGNKSRNTLSSPRAAIMHQAGAANARRRKRLSKGDVFLLFFVHYLMMKMFVPEETSKIIVREIGRRVYSMGVYEIIIHIIPANTQSGFFYRSIKVLRKSTHHAKAKGRINYRVDSIESDFMSSLVPKDKELELDEHNLRVLDIHKMFQEFEARTHGFGRAKV